MLGVVVQGMSGRGMLERSGEATRASPLEGICYCYYCC